MSCLENSYKGLLFVSRIPLVEQTSAVFLLLQNNCFGQIL